MTTFWTSNLLAGGAEDVDTEALAVSGGVYEGVKDGQPLSAGQTLIAQRLREAASG